MALDVESFTKEVETTLDKMEVEAQTAAGVRGAEASEDTTPSPSEDVGGQVVDNDVDVTGGLDTDADREEAEATKVLGEETIEKTEDIVTDTDEKTPVQFDGGVLARAVACGITLSEARSFPDNGELTRFVDSVEQNLIHEAAPEKETVATDDGSTDLFAGLPELKEDDYSPEVLQHLDRQKQVLTKQQEQLNAMEQRADSVQESTHRAGEREMIGWFDTAVEGLGDDYKEALGEGVFGSLSETSKEFANRNDIAGHMALVHDGYVAQNRIPPSRDELFEVAVRVVLPEAHANIQQRKLEGELESQSSQHLQRARGTNSKSTKSPEEETVALLNEKYDL